MLKEKGYLPLSHKGLNEGIGLDIQLKWAVLKEMEMYRKPAAIYGKILCLVSKVWSLRSNIDN
jgi:hypothetical protein